MTKSRWRRKAKIVIAQVVKETGIDDLDALEKAIRAAYPFGPREMWPYKVWLSEVRTFMTRLRRSAPQDDVDLTGLPLFDKKDQ